MLMTNYLVITKHKKEAGKPDLQKMEAFVKGKSVGVLYIRSGLAGKQAYRTKAQQRKGRGEVIPEAIYPLAGLMFKGGHGNFTSLYGKIASPIWVHIDPVEIDQRWLGIHLDHPSGVMGTLGCVGLLSIADCKTFSGWVDQYGKFEFLYVDWSLGTVTLPTVEEVEQEEPHCDHMTGTALVYGTETPFKNIDGHTWIRSSKIVGSKATWDSERTYPLIVERTT